MTLQRPIFRRSASVVVAAPAREPSRAGHRRRRLRPLSRTCGPSRAAAQPQVTNQLVARAPTAGVGCTAAITTGSTCAAAGYEPPGGRRPVPWRRPPMAAGRSPSFPDPSSGLRRARAGSGSQSPFLADDGLRAFPDVHGASTWGPTPTCRSPPPRSREGGAASFK
ncbi:hypothetical protein L083_4332 [Actinoplanes sp. N902-109]|nr:hypothetical protein L083_4332 [Actinoplanes sp. N902-109]